MMDGISSVKPRCSGSMGLAKHAQQHPFEEALCICTTNDNRRSASAHREPRPSHVTYLRMSQSKAGRQASMFLVEDEALIRIMIAEMIEELGHRVVAEAGSILDAQRLAQTVEFDLALLDVNVGGHSIAPVAQCIEERGLPFLFVSGYGSSDLPEPFRGRSVIQKPFVISRLRDAIEAILDR
jgi:CheY-like chemotaxis protein